MLRFYFLSPDPDDSTYCQCVLYWKRITLFLCNVMWEIAVVPGTMLVGHRVSMNITDSRNADFYSDIDQETIFILDRPQAKKVKNCCCAPHVNLFLPLVLLFFFYTSRWQATPVKPSSRKQACVRALVCACASICAGVCFPPCLSVWWREAAVPGWRGMPAGSDEKKTSAIGGMRGQGDRNGGERECRVGWSRQIEPSGGERLMREVPRVERRRQHLLVSLR